LGDFCSREESQVLAGEDVEKKLLIFLSHAIEDIVTVRDLCRQLKVDGFDPWLDEERLLPGQDWNLEIEKTLAASDAILLCFSSMSIAKEGYIQREYKRAMQQQEEKPEGTIFVIPVRLDSCPMPRFIREIQYVDYPAGYSRLVLSLRVRAIELKNASSKKGNEGFQTGPGHQVGFDTAAAAASSIRLLRLGTPIAAPVIETSERIVTIGRAPKNMVVMTDPDISWEHGFVMLRQEGYVYCHLSKSTSTVIRRKHDEYRLRPGKDEEFVLQNQDRLVIGSTVFVVEFNLNSEDTGYTTTHKKWEDTDGQ
jgi:hypothetical protein